MVQLEEGAMRWPSPPASRPWWRSISPRGAAFGIVTPAFAEIALSIVGCAIVILLRRRPR